MNGTIEQAPLAATAEQVRAHFAKRVAEQPARRAAREAQCAAEFGADWESVLYPVYEPSADLAAIVERARPTAKAA